LYKTGNTNRFKGFTEGAAAVVAATEVAVADVVEAAVDVLLQDIVDQRQPCVAVKTGSKDFKFQSVSSAFDLSSLLLLLSLLLLFLKACVLPSSSSSGQ
jgi:hypothetical protein